MAVGAARDSCTSLSSAIAVSSCIANPTDCAHRQLFVVSVARPCTSGAGNVLCCRQHTYTFGHDGEHEASSAHDRSDIKGAVQGCTWAELAADAAASCRA